MDNIYKVKTLLEEAARFATSSVMGHDRLAVILMDNLVEIQLGKQMQFVFRKEFLNDYKTLKYPLDKRKDILSKHDKLLKVCYEEKIITAYERSLLGFCHEIRNRLYHRGDDDKLLIEIAISTLYEVVLNHQPKWGGGTDMIRVPINFDGTPIDWEHPFTKERKKELGSAKYETGSAEDWLDFVTHRFKIPKEEDKSPSKLLSEFLLVGVQRLSAALDYALKRSEKKMEAEELLLQYSFKIKHGDELQRIKEMKGRKAKKTLQEDLFKSYKQAYRPLPIKRINLFKTTAEKLASLPSGEALEKYMGIRTDFYLMHDAFVLAAQEMQNSMFERTDRHLKKIKQRAS